MKWDEINFVEIDKSLLHILKHNVTLEEITNLLKSKFMGNKIRERRYRLLGEANHRILVLFIEHTETNKFFLLTAYDANLKHKRLYRRRVN